MKRHRILVAALLLGLLASPVPIARAQETQPVVRAVLFYSPSCGHCRYVITESLTPLFVKYGEQLQIVGVDVTQPQGQVLFVAALQKFGLETAGVPFLVVGDTYLVGSVQIPETFPVLIESYLAQGGVDWPDIPGLREALALSSGNETATAAAPTHTAPPQMTPVPATVAPAFDSPMATPGLDPAGFHKTDWRENFARDPAGNALAVLVLAGMSASIVWAAVLLQKTNGASPRGARSWSIPVLCAVGLGVAGYLAYVETAQVAAVCGPVGDCNTVQQSEYARLFGVLPVGVLGLMGYVAILIAWGIARYSRGHPAEVAAWSMFAMTAFGTLFSIYLTFLEPFVIGATCAWCLTSSVLMMALMLLSLGPAKLALSKRERARRA